MKKVWLVVTSFNDIPRVLGVYSTKEKAEKIAYTPGTVYTPQTSVSAVVSYGTMQNGSDLRYVYSNARKSILLGQLSWGKPFPKKRILSYIIFENGIPCPRISDS